MLTPPILKGSGLAAWAGMDRTIIGTIAPAPKGPEWSSAYLDFVRPVLQLAKAVASMAARVRFLNDPPNLYHITVYRATR